MALEVAGRLQHRRELIPRQHSQRLFPMLAEILPDGRLAIQGIDALVYGAGPGSFTGLRVCASAVQGLCFANSLPAIPVCTLLGQVYTALREGMLVEGQYVLSTLDAQIGEVYYRLCQVRGEQVRALHSPRVSRPEAMVLPEMPAQGVHVIGSGLHHRDSFADAIRQLVSAETAWLLPNARDLLLPAAGAWGRGEVQRADEVAPVYVRDEISWKKMPEQGKAGG